MIVTKTKQNENVVGNQYPLIFDKRKSDDIYKQFIGDTDGFLEDTLYIVLGADNGLILHYLVENRKKGQVFIVLEHQEVIEALIAMNSSWKNEFSFENLEKFNYEDLFDHYHDYVVRNAVQNLKSISAQSEFGPYADLVNNQNNSLRKFNIDREDNRNYHDFYDAQFKNICDLHTPIKSIENSLNSNIPVIVLGGGPSLDTIIPWLKENQNNIWIFAASRISTRLYKENIIPDFIGAVDYQEVLFDISKDMLKFQDQTVLLTGEHPGYGILQQWPGSTAYSRYRFPWKRDAESNYLTLGPTITNALLGFAVSLGAKTIYLAGVDFCFSETGQCHESSSLESTHGIYNNFDTVVETYEGKKAGTTIQFYNAVGNLEKQVAFFKKNDPGVCVKNLNPNAAKANGVDVANVLNIQLGPEKPNFIKDNANVLIPTSSSTLKYLDKLSNQVDKNRKWLSGIKREAAVGLKKSQKLFQNGIAIQKNVTQVLKNKKKVEKLLGDDLTIFVNYKKQEFMETVRPVEDLENMTEQEIASSLQGFFSGVVEASEQFLSLTESVKNEIAFRKLELDENYDFSLIAKGWMDRNIPGRLAAWKKLVGDDYFESVAKEFDETIRLLETKFQERLNDESILIEFAKSQEVKLNDYVDALSEAYDQKQIMVLTQISQQLNSINQLGVDTVQKFAKALILDLNSKSQQALEMLLSESNPNQYESFQLKIYQISLKLGQAETAIHAISSLCKTDLKYVPMFARFMKASNMHDRAISLLQNYPLLYQDTDSVILYLRLLVDVGRVELANDFLQQVDGLADLNQAKLQDFVDSLNQS